MRPVIIAVAITGSVPRRKDNPAVPITPDEQIESTRQAYEAGAALVHIHVRNDDETPSSDPDRFAAVQAGVARHCPGMIIQFSTGGRGRDPAQRSSALGLRPDMASLSTGSVNFPTIVYENSAALVTDLLGDPSRRVDSDSPFAYAWGDPPVVLVCGVDRPAGWVVGESALQINGVQFYVDTDDPRTTVWTAVDRAVYVEVQVPSSSDSAGVTQLTIPIAANLEQQDPDPAG